MNSNYLIKYLKYKNKYLKLKKTQNGGMDCINDRVFKNDTSILLDDKRIEEVKCRISKLENSNTIINHLNNNDNNTLFNTIEDFIKN